MLRPIALLLLAALTLGLNAQENDKPKPILSLTYGFYIGGMDNGTVVRKLYQTGEHEYRFETIITPEGLASWYLDKTMHQTTSFRVTDKGVLPLRYDYFERGKKTRAPIVIEFDWNTRQAKQSKPVERQWDIDESYVDAETTFFSIIYFAIKKQESFELQLLNGKRATPKAYRYIVHGKTEKLDTDLGELDVILVREDSGPNDKYINMTWLAPGMGYIPVRIDQDIKGEPDLSMRLQRVEADDPNILIRILAE